MCFLTSCWMKSGVVGDLKRHDTLINRCDIKLLRSKMYLINTPYYHHWSRKPTDNIKSKISNVYGNQAGSCCNSICLSESNKLSWSWKASALNSSFLTYGESCHLSIKQPDGKWCRYYLVYILYGRQVHENRGPAGLCKRPLVPPQFWTHWPLGDAAIFKLVLENKSSTFQGNCPHVNARRSIDGESHDSGNDLATSGSTIWCHYATMS